MKSRAELKGENLELKKELEELKIRYDRLYQKYIKTID